MFKGQQPLLHLTVRSFDTSSSTAPILVTSSLTVSSTTTEKSNSSSFLIFGKHSRRGSPNYATSSAHAKLILGSSQAKQPKQWILPQHLIGLCRSNSWPLPADVPHHPDGCPATALSKKKTRKINFFLTSVRHGEDEEINERRSFARARCRRLLEEGKKISPELSLPLVG